jgi:haloacetate dehalogenase
MLEGFLADMARAQKIEQGGAPAHGSPFETSLVEVSGNTVFVRRYGRGSAILMVHGFPRTSLMWRFLAPTLAEKSHGDLRRSASLRAQRSTRIYR